MQAHFTQFGRVEADPLRVPRSAATKGSDTPFARELDAELVRPAQAPPAEHEPPAVEAAPASDETPALAANAPQPHAPVQQHDAPAQAPARAAGDAESIAAPVEPGAPGAVASRARSPQPAQPAVAEAATQPATNEHRAAVAAPSQAAHPVAVPGAGAIGAAATAAAAVKASSPSGLTSLAASEARGSRATIAAPSVGYRNVEKAALERIEAARASVLRQIVFKLQDGLSEAHMQLDPPELGALDLRLAVDAAGQTTLSVVTERPEVAALLNQSLPALASSLAGQGLTVTHADVRSREGKNPAPEHAPRTPRTSPSGANDPVTPSILPPHAFVSHAGLDFWA